MALADRNDSYEDWHPEHPPMQDPTSNYDDTLCGTKPSPKNDITNAFAANNNEYLFTAMERRANTGTTSFFWKFDVGQDGDGGGAGGFADGRGHGNARGTAQDTDGEDQVGVDPGATGKVPGHPFAAAEDPSSGNGCQSARDAGQCQGGGNE